MSAKLAYVLTILVACIQLASANFDLYHIHGVEADGPFPGAEINGWQLQNDNPTCDQADQFAVWRDSSDLSHGRKGAPWPDVKLIEMHFTNNPLYHFTIYKDRGYTTGDGGWRWYLYGTDDKADGTCFAWVKSFILQLQLGLQVARQELGGQGLPQVPLPH
ncbi:uncharacterized protein CC84DRAFT_1181471 [Paraphaeosphaeria sporulosa]|uniref:Uncharacterized protein n=1 Tax=Paraphaeosphaeria sporulosa TaxID=1460663 RepID=A0A177BV43_9PLEO|nr:uncharacterized protein CC84DRAFT_1181471 [Paraphaeosphaeria sporulosa]OAF99343.1 hypothetical protein CC84DRAFT_1181471 [Paraphaeosphaeria sporulosa]